jgi:hypothetical protein
MVLSPEGHLSGRVATLSRVAHLSCLLLLLFPLALSAQNGVTVSNLVINAGTVTFNVSWNADAMPVTLWSDSVWVFVDYNNNGVMWHLPLMANATLTSSVPDGGKVIQIPGNDRGVWVVGNARSAGSFSATVQLLTATTGIAGACVYASNYPPVGEYITTSNISFTGTPPYDLVLKHTDGNTITPQSSSDYYVPAGYTLQSFTDKTGAPGFVRCVPPAAPAVADATFCFGRPGQLQAVASGGATIAWYDAPTAGNLLYTGSVLPLVTPLYNNTAQYYAQADIAPHCVSARTAAHYTVNNCTISGDCPEFTAGSVGSATVPAACSSFYPGRIGATGYPVACVSFDAGRIGRSQ